MRDRMDQVEGAFMPWKLDFRLRFLPKDQTVGVDVLLIDLDRLGFGERGMQPSLIADRADLVRRPVRNAVQHDCIAYTLHRSRRDDALSLDRHCLRPAAPKGIDHGLDVLLVHYQEVGFDSVRCHAGGRIIEGYRNRRSGDRCQADAVGPSGEIGSAVRPLIGASGEPVDFLTQRGDLASQFAVMARLGLYQADQISIPSRSQISALRVQRASDDH